jgi:hypothetical protein
MPPRRPTQILDSLTKSVEALRQKAGMPERNTEIAQAMRDLADLLNTPLFHVPAEPHYETTEDYRGDPFSSGAPIPYRKGSSLYRALAIFRDCANPITRGRFIELGGRSEVLDRLLNAGLVVKLEV